LFIVFLLLFLSACGTGGKSTNQEGSANPQPMKAMEPVTLMLQSQFNGTSKEVWESTLGAEIKKKFPHVTPVYIQRGKGSTIQDLITSGDIPDILWGNLSGIKDLILSTGLNYDLSELVKKNNVDLNQFEPAYIQAIKDANPDGALLGLPKGLLKPYVLFYNKDLFDKFGVPYPKDGMTWDQVYELAKKMTRTDGETVYRGYASAYHTQLRDNPFSVAPMDVNQDKLASVDIWAKMFANISRFYEIQNNHEPSKKYSSLNSLFYKEKNIAMEVAQITEANRFIQENMNWDMVSEPTFPELPKTSSYVGADYYYVTKTSKNKDAAFQVVSWLVSKEFQEQDASKNAAVPSLRTVNMEKVFAKEAPGWEGKNVKALTTNKMAPAPKVRKNDPYTFDQYKALYAAIDDVVFKQKDINTALREAAESFHKSIEADKGK
jgi:multiple sugar transport system substrate-binding protein